MTALTNTVSTTKISRYSPPSSKSIEADKARAIDLLKKILNSQKPYAINSRQSTSS